MEILATNPQKQQIHRLKRSNGWDEDTYRELIHQFSNGRTTSSKELTKREATAFIRQFMNESTPVKVSHSMRMECLSLVKAIYAVSLEISFLNKDYQSNDPDDIAMNKAKINHFVMNHGVVKKPISRMNYDELKDTLKQLKSISNKEQ